MNIAPYSTVKVFHAGGAAAQAVGSPKTSKASTGGDSLQIGAGGELRESLSVGGAVRPEYVERGKALARDPNYPPVDTMWEIATTFVEEVLTKKQEE